MVLITGVAYANANDCSDYKRQASKYEQMGMMAGNMDLGAKYLGKAIHYKKKALHVCFYSHFDKEKIRRSIKDMEEMQHDMFNEANRIRQQELDVARESADRNNFNFNYR